MARGGALTEEVIDALVEIATSDITSEMRVEAGSALARGGALTEEVIDVLVEIATSDEQFLIREQAVITLQHAPATRSLRKDLIELFRDDDNDVRRASAATLVELSRRCPEYASEIRAELASACTDSTLAEVDKFEHRSGWEYAHEGLSAHVEAIHYTGTG